MALNFEQIRDAFIGSSLTHTDLGRRSGPDLCIIISDFQFYPARMEQFGVTERLKDRWERTGSEIYLTLTLEGEAVSGIRTQKLREIGACARPNSRALQLTDQEIRIVRRVLEYLTQ